MAKSDLQQIFELVPHLTSDERKLLISTLQSIGPKIHNSNSTNDIHADIVIDTIVRVMKKLGDPVNAHQLKSNSNIKDKMPGLLEYLKGASPHRNGRCAILEIAVSLLYQNLQEMNVPISGVTLINHLHRIPAIMDLHFPGYARSGMLSLLLNGNSIVASRKAD